jgi:hypothetical protein
MLAKLLGAGFVVAGVLGSQASAAAVGVWLFDEVVDVTPPAGAPPVDPPGGETIYDETANNFDFLGINNFGTFSTSADRPTPITTGNSMLSVDGGASAPKTPSSSLFSRGKTGQLTIEFWLKMATQDANYIMSFGGGVPGGNRANEWGIYTNGAGALVLFDYEIGAPGVSVTSSNVGDNNWHHIAYTIDSTSIISYVDGVAGNSAASPPLNSTLGTGVSDKLNFGLSQEDTYYSHTFRIDEMRISDVALLPGSGSGVGELAWNASLVPEPAGISALIAVAGGFLARRRNR